MKRNFFRGLTYSSDFAGRNWAGIVVAIIFLISMAWSTLIIVESGQVLLGALLFAIAICFLALAGDWLIFRMSVRRLRRRLGVNDWLELFVLGNYVINPQMIPHDVTLDESLNYDFVGSVIAVTQNRQFCIMPTVAYTKREPLVIPIDTIKSVNFELINAHRKRVDPRVDRMVRQRALPVSVNAFINNLDAVAPIHWLVCRLHTSQGIMAFAVKKTSKNVIFINAAFGEKQFLDEGNRPIS